MLGVGLSLQDLDVSTPVRLCFQCRFMALVLQDFLLEGLRLEDTDRQTWRVDRVTLASAKLYVDTGQP